MTLLPILFALCLEPLCCIVTEHPEISGLRIGDDVTKVLAYADDAAVVCSSKQEVKLVLGLAKTFCAFSGAQLNKNK